MNSAKKTYYMIVTVGLFGALLLFLISANLKTDIVEFMATRLRLADPILLVIGDSRLALKIGNYYFNGGAYDLGRAKRAYQRALELDPRALPLHYQLARIYFVEGDFEAALDEINTEIHLHPELPNAYYVRGLVNGYRGNFADAEKDFRAFIAKVPQQWAGYNDLAWILAKEGKFAEVKKTIEEAFQGLPGIESRNPWLWISLGIARLNLGEYNEARNAFQTAIDLTDRMSASYFWSAYPGNNPQNAERAFKEFRATIHFNLGVVYENLRDFQKSVEEYRAYLALIPEESAVSHFSVEKKLKELENK